MNRLTRKTRRSKIEAASEVIEAPPTDTNDEESMRASTPPPASAPPHAFLPQIPAVYREDGYLILTLDSRKGEVHYLSTRDGGGSHHAPFPRFMGVMKIPQPPCNPYRLALNMIARKRAGTLNIRVRDERKLLSLLKASREELLKLEPDKLGAEYARIVGKTPPDSHPQDLLIKEIIMAVEEQVAKQETKDEGKKEEPKKDAAKPEAKKPAAKKSEAKKPAAKKPAAPAKKAAPKKPEAKKPAAKKPEAKKSEAKKPAAAKNADNPFRAGSMKHDAYEFFKKCGGDRAKTVEKTIALGATETTAKSWYSAFCKV